MSGAGYPGTSHSSSEMWAVLGVMIQGLLDLALRCSHLWGRPHQELEIQGAPCLPLRCGHFWDEEHQELDIQDPLTPALKCTQLWGRAHWELEIRGALARARQCDYLWGVPLLGKSLTRGKKNRRIPGNRAPQGPAPDIGQGQTEQAGQTGLFSAKAMTHPSQILWETQGAPVTTRAGAKLASPGPEPSAAWAPASSADWLG